MEEIRDYFRPFIKTVRKCLLKYAVQCPVLAVTLVILICTVLLPLVSATALSPLVALFYLWGYVQSKGFGSVLCALCFQGALLTAFIVASFGIVFLITSAADIFLSKYYHAPISGKMYKNSNCHLIS